MYDTIYMLLSDNFFKALFSFNLMINQNPVLKMKVLTLTLDELLDRVLTASHPIFSIREEALEKIYLELGGAWPQKEEEVISKKFTGYMDFITGRLYYLDAHLL